MIIDDDTGGNRQASGRCDLDIGQHADADHDQVGREMTAVAEADAGDLAGGRLDAVDLHAEMDADAGCGVAKLEEFGNLRCHRARHHTHAELDHVDLEPFCTRGGSELQTDETGADHDDVPVIDHERRAAPGSRRAYAGSARPRDWRWEDQAGGCARRWRARDGHSRANCPTPASACARRGRSRRRDRRPPRSSGRGRIFPAGSSGFPGRRSPFRYAFDKGGR